MKESIQGGDAVIFKNPEGVKLIFDDVVYGHIEVMSETLKDTVLIKSDGMPTYNYAVVIDDHCHGDHPRHPGRGPYLQHPEAASHL